MKYNQYPKSIVTEGVDEYIEGIDTVDDLHNFASGNKHCVIYARTWSKDLDSIKNTGLSREFIGHNGAHAYGYGLYCTTTLEGEQHGMGGYGDVILRIVIPGFNRCLIDPGVRTDFTSDLARATHGHMSFQEQVDMLVPNKKDADFLKRFGSCRGLVQNWSSISDSLYHHYDIDGIYWNNSDDWGLWKDFKRAIPYQKSLDNGKTWIPFATQNTVEVTANTYEPNVAFGKDIKKYFLSDPRASGGRRSAESLRCVNGYFLVQTDKGYNLVSPKTKQPVSPVWFDLCSNADNNGLVMVKHDNNSYYYYPAKHWLFTDTNIMDVLDRIDDGDYDLTDDELQPSKIAENKQHCILNEGLDEYVPDVDRSEINYNPNKDSKFYYFYRLALPQQTQSIATNGFSKEFRGTGNDNTDWLGAGTYGVQNQPTHPRRYGSIVWCYATPKSVVQNSYLTPHRQMAAKYGIKETYEQQLQKFFPEYYAKWKRNGLLRDILNPGGYTGSQMITRLLNALLGKPLSDEHACRRGAADHILHAAGVKGILYRGNIDGEAVLTTDDGTIIPISYKDLNIPNDTWHKVEISDQLWDRTYNFHDPMAFIGGNYSDYLPINGTIPKNWEEHMQTFINTSRVTNGYMLVKRKADGKYNLLKAPEGRNNFASPVWFDMCSDVDKYGLARVKQGGQLYYYNPTEHTLFMDEQILDVLDRMDDGDYDLTDSELA